MKGLCLLSTGIDSPVAAWRMQQLGMELVFLHTGKPNKTLKQLVQQLGGRQFFVVSHDYMKQIIPKINPRFTCLICKRMMYRIAEQIAKENECEVLITGENLGQVASQTLDNLIVLSSSIRMPVLRPLLAFDKQETIKSAKAIGTYELSIQNQGVCPFLPKHPATAARVEQVEREEARLDIPNLLQRYGKPIQRCV